MFDNWLILFTLVFARVGGLIATAPIFATDDVPMRLRAALAATIALLITPLEANAVGAVSFGGWMQWAVLLGIEAAIGAALGLGILVFVHAMTMAGELIGQGAGLSLAETFDPSLGENVPLFSRLMFLTAVAVFLCIGGHRMAMAGLLDTFQAIPPGKGWFPDSLGAGITTLVAQSFSLAVRVAAPAVVALLLATVVLGLVGRTLPQLNIFALGFGMNSMLAFAALGLTLGAALWAFQDQITPALETVFDPMNTPLQTQWMR